MNGGLEPTEFAEVLERWLVVDHERRNARLQFSGGFSQGNRYSIERLVSSANMFDILPVSAAPKKVNLPDDIRIAKAEAKRVFSALPKSMERDSVLNALGRLETATLKHKVRHRGEIVLAAAPSHFPDLFLVLDEAVNCRNHFVHGSSTKIDFHSNFFETVPFFTDTLEFVFAASDLIEAGWKVISWLNTPTSMSHPFGRLRISYTDKLNALKALLEPATSDAKGT